MRELPMLLNGEMVRATMDGRKVMTRRPARNIPSWVTRISYVGGSDLHWMLSGEDWHMPEFRRNPLGVPGDLLYVRETHTWITLAENEYDPENPCHKRHPRGYPVVMIYRADWQQEVDYGRAYVCNEPRWRPSIHMPKWAARTWCRNMGVRVERVQDITEDDADLEGFAGDIPSRWFPDIFWRTADDGGDYYSQFSIPECYGILWDSIYAKRGMGWKVDPFVFVTSYEVIER